MSALSNLGVIGVSTGQVGLAVGAAGMAVRGALFGGIDGAASGFGIQVVPYPLVQWTFWVLLLVMGACIFANWGYRSQARIIVGL